jgi:hypothetical protein
MFKTRYTIIDPERRCVRWRAPLSAGLWLLAMLGCGSDASSNGSSNGSSSGSSNGSSNGSGGPDVTNPSPTPAVAGPFKSLEAVANAPSAFTQPRAGVPLPNGDVAIIATLESLSTDDANETGQRVGVLLAPAGGGAPRVLYSGDGMVDPFDLAVSQDGKTLYVADPAVGTDTQGALLVLPASGGEPTAVARGFAPRSVTVAPDDSVYFSGVDPETGAPGVFRLNGAGADRVYVGSPLVDPSGIVVLRDGRVLVADTRLFDALPAAGTVALGNEAGIVQIDAGQATVLASGFATGYPAGIATTTDEAVLIVSGEGPDRSDTVYIINLATPDAAPLAVTDVFSAFKDSSAGLKRAHDENTFIWASLAADGGTVYRIVAN